MSPQPDHYNAEFLRRNNFAQPAPKQIVGRAAVTTPPSPAVPVSKPIPTIPVQTPAGGTIPATQPVAPTVPPVDETHENTLMNPEPANAPAETTNTVGTPVKGEEGNAASPEEVSGTPEAVDDTLNDESEDSENKGEEGSEQAADDTATSSDDKTEEPATPEEVKEEKPVKKRTSSRGKKADKSEAK